MSDPVLVVLIEQLDRLHKENDELRHRLKRYQPPEEPKHSYQVTLSAQLVVWADDEQEAKKHAAEVLEQEDLTTLGTAKRVET
jgi:hypothetical protein